MAKVVLLNTREAAEYRGVTERQVQRLAEAGLWKVHSVGARNSLRFRKGDIRYATTTLKGR